MPSAANGEVDKHTQASNAENSPIRRMVEILQGKIASLEKQRTKLASGGKGGKDASASGEPKANSVKIEELNQMLEFVWDLCKQAMGIAILSENEAKKQARKESVVRKSQDTQLVRDVLLVLDCLEQLNDPTARQDFLAGTGGATQLTENDLRVLDDIYPEVTPKHALEEGDPSFEEQTMSAAKHLIAIIDGSPAEVIGTTYAHIKSVVDSVHDCGYLDLPKDASVEGAGLEEGVGESRETEPTLEESEFVQPPQSSPPSQAAPPPPAPQAVPTPTFPILPPNAPPVTLQQVEHAYFAQQYGHQQKPPIPEVFSPLNFIFLQESEIDTPEPQPPQQTSPQSVTPNSIPSQTFTNQNFALPGQHYTGPEPHMAPLPPGASPHFQQDAPPNHMTGFPAGNPPPPIPMPTLGMPPQSYQQNLPYKVSHAHPHPMDRVLPSAPTPPNTAEVPPHQENRIPTPQQHSQDADYSNWNNPPQADDKNADQLEIDEWNSSDNKNEHEGEGGNYSDGQSGNRFRSRGRGRSGSGGNYRGRGGYQNGGRSNGNFYRNNDNYQSRGGNTNGDNGYRDSGSRHDNSQGGYQQAGYKGGRGNTEGRGGWNRREGNSGGGSGKGGASRRGGPPRDGGNRGGYYQRKGTSNAQYGNEGRAGSENKQYAQ